MKKLILFCVALFESIHGVHRGFLFSLPNILEAGKNETVCISLHQLSLPSKIRVDLKWNDIYNTTIKNLNEEFTCFELEVPNHPLIEPSFLKVRIQVQSNSKVYSAHNQDPIVLYPVSSKVLIETDRRLYKPGDNVQFLVLELNRSLLPVNKGLMMIKLKNPLDVTVMVWQNAKFSFGLANFQYQLVREAMPGMWTIHVDNQIKQFEVTNYVLPRFKVDLFYPKTVYYKINEISVNVCAKYSYNQPVKGLTFIKISHSLTNFEFNTTEMVNGCAEYHMTRTHLGLDNILENSDIHIIATVTEHGTNKIEITNGNMKVTFKRYELKFLGKTIFNPGVPYEGFLKLTGNLTSCESIEICYTLAIKKSWNYWNNEQCQNYTTNGTMIKYNLWSFKSSVLHVRLRATSLTNPSITTTQLLVRLYSSSQSYIQAKKKLFKGDGCNGYYEFDIMFNREHFKDNETVKFVYFVKTSKGILQLGKYSHSVQLESSVLEDSYLGEMHKYVKTNRIINTFSLRFNVTNSYASKFTLLVYYVTKDGEIVSISTTETVSSCTLPVNAQWLHPQVLPGAKATLKLSSDQAALCFVAATDKAVKFMNSHRKLTLESIIKRFSSEYPESTTSGRSSCVSTPKHRSKRHVYSFSEDFDSYDIFSKSSTVTITNLQLITKPCYIGPLINDTDQVQSLIDQYHTSVDDDESQSGVRSYFPETWIWQLIFVNNTNQVQLNAPDSITSWLTNVFCVSETGIGFAEETELTTFKSFFVDVLLPHSLKKGENFNLLVHVSNYLNYSFPVKLSISLTSNLGLIHDGTVTYCLIGNDTNTHVYPIRAISVGIGKITIFVENESQYPDNCGPEVVVSKRDVVIKTVNIEPEGYFTSTTKSALLCDSKDNFRSNVTWQMDIPKEVVADTEKVLVSVNADILSHTIKNLDQLLTIPTGCGEQIMASMAPNLRVLQYLNATGRLTSSIRQKIIKNLKLGYQRILNYVHPDGSFSAFGTYDSSGSMFLTTFVVKVLQGAKKVIYVDSHILRSAIHWIFDHQFENGCFDSMYHVFQDMGGTTMDNNPIGITAYVIISLFDSEVKVLDTVQTNAKYCIRSQTNLDKYSRIINSLALYKLFWVSEGKRLMDEAIAEAHRQDGQMWWQSAGSETSDIEITSYALLTLLEQRSSEYLAHAHSVVRWLVTKMSSTGSFKSTQDTVVALEALTKYISMFRGPKVSLNVQLNTTHESHKFQIDRQDDINQLFLKTTQGDFTINVQGRGCALIQLTTSYYTTILSDSESFRFSVDVAPISTVDKCSITSFSPCIAYDGSDNVSNMAVMELSLPSGFRVDRASLYQLIESRLTENVKMFEETDRSINIYFTKLTKNLMCFSFNINEQFTVGNRKDNLIKVYDYYRPDKRIIQFYSLNSSCSNVTL